MSTEPTSSDTSSSTGKEIILFQVGRVDANTIATALKKAQVDVQQSSFLDEQSFHNIVDNISRLSPNSWEKAEFISKQLQKNLALRSRIRFFQDDSDEQQERLGIITLVRDPLDWYLSGLADNATQFLGQLRPWLEAEKQITPEQEIDSQHIHYFLDALFDTFDKTLPNMNRDNSDIIRKAHDSAKMSSNRQHYCFIYTQVSELNRVNFWFDKHFLPVLDYDLLAQAFDKKSSYSIHHVDNIDILVLKYEDLATLSDAIADFCETPPLSIQQEPSRGEQTSPVATAIASYKIPDQFTRKYCSSEYYERFYADENAQSQHEVPRRRYIPDALKGNPDNIDRVSRYHKSKRETLESFIDFTQGKGIPKWPLEVFLEVSNVCDLKCAMCPTFSAINPNRFINLKHADRGLFKIENTKPLEEILEHAIIVHAFGYGEPTIHPQFKEFVTFLSQYEVLIDFFSHGMHLTEELCDFLVSNSIFRVTLSFSGATKEEYENIYLGGEFERVLAGIRRLSDTKKRYQSDFPNIEINSIGFKHHIDKLPQFVELMGEAGANVINLKPLQTYDIIEELHTHASVMRPDVEGKIIEQAKEIAKKYGLILASKPYEDTAYFSEKFDADATQARHKGENTLSTKEVKITDIKQLAESTETKETAKKLLKETDMDGFKYGLFTPDNVKYFKNRNIPCLEPFKTFYASYDGRIFPCCFKGTEDSLGIINTGSDGMELWNNPMFTDLKDHALLQELPSKLCGQCIKSSIYPKTHSVGQKIAHYSRWFSKTLGVPFHPHIQKASRALPDNQQIINNHKTAKD